MNVGPRAGTHSYARWEFERRLLVARVPPGLDDAHGWDVTDRYIRGSQLRLRRMTPLAGGEPVFKLGKKEVPDPSDFSRMKITTIYLTAAEHDLLVDLPADELHKRRFRIEDAGRVFGVDVFGGALSGLILAETDFATADELEQELDLPEWVVRDVSRDVRFTGGALAGLSDDARAGLVRAL